MAEPIRSFFLAGPAGRLEALLNPGALGATHAALVCHPHPLFGGTLHNKVVYGAAKTLRSFGFPVLRFNFRGAGLSQGEHDDGRGEQDDVRAALDWLRGEFHLPIVFCGFSFGAAVGLRVCCAESDVPLLISLGTPVQSGEAGERSYNYDYLAECRKPKLFLSGARDQYGPAQALRQIVQHAAPPSELVLIEDADHFFAGKLPEMRAALEQWIRTTVVL